MQISILLLIIPYFFVLLLFIYGWLSKKPLKSHGLKSYPFTSILIPVKDEEKNLSSLISDLLNQTYPDACSEIIFIDDHSEDRSSQIIKACAAQNSSVKLISLVAGMGKKTALWEGIKAAKGDLIITTDGDCRYPAGWITAMVRYYLNFPGHLLIGPVLMKEQKGLFNKFQNLEFLSLIASAAGSSGVGRPILCNGANLGADARLFQKAEKVYKSSVASGDDIFLLLELKKHKIPAVFVKDIEATVKTNNSSGFKQFMSQRTRWTFKSRFYRDFDIIFVAIIVLFTNMLLLGGLLYSVANPEFLTVFLIFYLLKCFVDYILLYNVAKFFNRIKLLRLFLIHQLVYIFYVSFVGIAGHFSFGKWKGRKKQEFGYGRS